MHEAHERALAALARRGRLRRLEPRDGEDFASNDYLGLAQSPALAAAVAAALDRGVPIGAGGSRLLRGNHPEHEALEAEAAAFFKAQSALYFGGGFIANAALFATLPQRGDLVVHDALIHASAREGLGLTKADVTSAPHNDAQAVCDAIRRWRALGGKGRPWIAVESLYSMDGDRAPLAELVAIAERHDAILLVDEAHATGVWGDGGRGLGAAFEGRDNIVSLHTCGKALGVMGALVCGPRVLTEFLVNRARPFIYATAPSPLMATGVRAALQIIAREPQRRVRLHQRIEAFAGGLAAIPAVTPSRSQIQPVIVKTDARATTLAAALQAEGFDVRAVRPPTVPEGTARLRLSLTLNVDDTATARLIETLGRELEGLAP